MKIMYKLVFGLSLFAFSNVNAQENTPKRLIDKENCREGENVEYCLHHKKLQEKLKNPAFKKAYETYQLEISQIINQSKSIGIEKGTIYKIPVVFHVLHNGGIENISREQILDALSILNRDYRRLNSDANIVKSDFLGMPADIEIEFVLATKAPNGQCFSGITKTQNALTSDGSDGDAQVNAIKNGNDVYQGTWQDKKYLNIYVCEEIGGAAGYTFNPWGNGTGMNTGIWILHNYVGSIGTSDVSHSRALTHEVGHWLDLSHTWGDNNNPGNTSSCDYDDHVDDTPVCIGVTSCTPNINTCNDLNTSNGVSSSWNYDVVDNVENYMDYSYCSKMFTEGQKTRMRASLLSSSGGRNNIWTSANLSSVGANGNATICKADFTSDKTIICAGDSVHFEDLSYNAASGWTWTLTGASPSTSTIQNPGVIYNTPGTYTVQLAATDGNSTQTSTKTSYITVLPAGTNLPFFDSFETYSSLTNNGNWIVSNPGNNNAFTLFTGAGATGSKCVKLGNYGQSGSNVDELYGVPVDLSGLSSSDVVTLSFKYAYRKVQSGNNESLKIYASTNCGDSWNVRKTVSGNTLSTITASSAWTPTTSDWVTVHVTNLISTYFVDNFRYKFRFEGNGGNNFYLDDINLYLGQPSNTNVTSGVNEIATNYTDLSVYPNPADNEIQISYNALEQNQMIFTIIDVTGKNVQTNQVSSNEGTNLVLLDIAKLNAGMYLLKISNGNSEYIKPIVIK